MSQIVDIVNYLMDHLKEYPTYRQKNWDNNESGNIPYLEITLAFTIFVFIFEILLDFRQLNKFKTAKSLPKELVGKVTAEVFTKSLDYGKDKYSFGIFSGFIRFVEGIVLTLLGSLPFAWDVADSLGVRFSLVSETSSPLYKEIITTVFFLNLCILFQTIESLPFTLYSTFVIEQRHGFNKMTLALFLKDMVQSLALSFVLMSPVIGGVVWIVRLGGPYFYFYVWGFLFVVALFMMAIYPTLIAPIFNKYTKLEHGELYDSIAELAKKVSFPLTQIFTVDGSKRSGHSNAYFFGFFKNKRIVLYDTLLTQVEKPELLAILGHEIGHWKLWHTIEGFVISQIFIFVLFLSFSFVQNTPGMFTAFGFTYTPTVPMPVFVGLLLFTQTFWSPVDKVLTLAMNFNSRKNEFAADAFASKLGMAKDLGTGLLKLSIENLGNMVPDPWYSMYHFSHPPLVERLAALKLDKQE